MTRSKVMRIQYALNEKGFNPGPIDGIRGSKTDAAITAFKISIGYLARPYFGPLTEAALFEGLVDPVKSTITPVSDPVWLRKARGYLGLREYRGSRHNAQILEWWELIRAPFTDDETPWCAGFVGGVLESCGIRSTRSAAARSYERTDWGTVLDGPCVGAIVVFWRKSRHGPYGHVGIVVGRDQWGNLMVIGGNQGNAVTIKPFDLGRVVSYHYPKAHTPPRRIGFNTLPIVRSDGSVSVNEA